MIARGRAAASTDFSAAQMMQRAILIAREIRLEHSIPHLGYVREAVRLASKVFSSIEGKKVDGTGPIVAALVRHGAVRSAAQPDISVLDGDELLVRIGKYRFSGSDLDSMVSMEMKRAYPENLSELITAMWLADAPHPAESNIARVLELGLAHDARAESAFSKIVGALEPKSDPERHFIHAVVLAAKSPTRS